MGFSLVCAAAHVFISGFIRAQAINVRKRMSRVKFSADPLHPALYDCTPNQMIKAVEFVVRLRWLIRVPLHRGLAPKKMLE